MKIEVTPETKAVIDHLMATGRYASEGEALQAALDERVDPDTGLTVGQLRAEIQKGIDSGPAVNEHGQPLDGAAAMANIWERVQAKRQA